MNKFTDISKDELLYDSTLVSPSELENMKAFIRERAIKEENFEKLKKLVEDMKEGKVDNNQLKITIDSLPVQSNSDNIVMVNDQMIDYATHRTKVPNTESLKFKYIERKGTIIGRSTDFAIDMMKLANEAKQLGVKYVTDKGININNVGNYCNLVFDIGDNKAKITITINDPVKE